MSGILVIRLDQSDLTGASFFIRTSEQGTMADKEQHPQVLNMRVGSQLELELPDFLFQDDGAHAATERENAKKHDYDKQKLSEALNHQLLPADSTDAEQIKSLHTHLANTNEALKEEKRMTSFMDDLIQTLLEALRDEILEQMVNRFELPESGTREGMIERIVDHFKNSNAEVRADIVNDAFSSDEAAVRERLAERNAVRRTPVTDDQIKANDHYLAGMPEGRRTNEGKLAEEGEDPQGGEHMEADQELERSDIHEREVEERQTQDGRSEHSLVKGQMAQRAVEKVAHGKVPTEHERKAAEEAGFELDEDEENRQPGADKAVGTEKEAGKQEGQEGFSVDTPGNEEPGDEVEQGEDSKDASDKAQDASEKAQDASEDAQEASDKAADEKNGTGDSSASYEDMEKDDLKDMARKRGLKVGGNRDDLIKRLKEDDES